MKANAKKVGKRIKMLRLNNELTLKELGKNLSLSISTINSWERGISLPRKETLSLLANFFNVDENWLLFGSVEEYLTDIIEFYNLENQISKEEAFNFKKYLVEVGYIVGNLNELRFYAKEHLPILAESISVELEKEIKKKISLHNIGNMYPIIQEEIMQEKILPLLQMLLSDKNKETNKKMIENYLLKMLLNE